VKKDLLRIIDANLNRSREGLRVCEEIARFILEDEALTKELKKIRHGISRNIKKIPAISDKLLSCRKSSSDVGKEIPNKSRRKSYKDVFAANIQRAEEALRVLEEFSKILNHTLSKNFAHLRFKVYELEKKTIARL